MIGGYQRLLRRPAATATTGALGFRAGFVDGQCAAIEFGAIKSGDGSFGFGVIGHLDKSEPLGLAGVAVGDDTDAIDGSVSFKHGANRIFRGREAEVPYKDIFHVLPLEFAELRIAAGIGRERIVPDDARDAKISGPVNYNPIVARNRTWMPYRLCVFHWCALHFGGFEEVGAMRVKHWNVWLIAGVLLAAAAPSRRARLGRM